MGDGRGGTDSFSALTACLGSPDCDLVFRLVAMLDLLISASSRDPKVVESARLRPNPPSSSTVVGMVADAGVATAPESGSIDAAVIVTADTADPEVGMEEDSQTSGCWVLCRSVG